MSVRLMIFGMITVLLWACDSSPSSTPADSGAGTDVSSDRGGVTTTGFKADPEPTSAAVYISVDLANPAAPLATVWAARLGPVFGLAVHLRLDEKMLSTHDPAAEPFLGPDTPKNARYLAIARSADIALGAVRRGPAANEVDITSPVKVATIPLVRVAPGTSRIEVRDLQVRRVDGSFTSAQTAGGELSWGGQP